MLLSTLTLKHYSASPMLYHTAVLDRLFNFSNGPDPWYRFREQKMSPDGLVAKVAKTCALQGVWKADFTFLRWYEAEMTRSSMKNLPITGIWVVMKVYTELPWSEPDLSHSKIHIISSFIAPCNERLLHFLIKMYPSWLWWLSVGMNVSHCPFLGPSSMSGCMWRSI